MIIIILTSCNEMVRDDVNMVNKNECKLCNSIFLAKDEIIKINWLKENIEFKKLVENYLIIRKGLSGTGKVIISEKYNSMAIENFCVNGDPVYLIIQNDLFGERMHWQYLINPKNKMSYKLYHNINTEPQIEQIQ